MKEEIERQVLKGITMAIDSGNKIVDVLNKNFYQIKTKFRMMEIDDKIIDSSNIIPWNAAINNTEIIATQFEKVLVKLEEIENRIKKVERTLKID